MMKQSYTQQSTENASARKSSLKIPKQETVNEDGSDDDSISTHKTHKTNPRRYIMDRPLSPPPPVDESVEETSTTVFPTVPEQVTVANNQNSSITHSQVTASSTEEIASLR